MDYKTLLYSTHDDCVQRFYQCPKVFDEIGFYRTMSIGAKYMYAVLRDRQDLSIKNEWLDRSGHIYFYFDCNKLSELLNISTNTVNKYKKELVDHFLLLQVRQGQGSPNRMYILKPVSVENTLNSENCISRIAKIAFLELRKSLSNDTEINDPELMTLKQFTAFEQSGAVEFVSLYDSLYSDWYGRKHPRVRKESIYRMIDGINDIIHVLESKEEHHNMIIEYFQQLNESNNGNILAFVTAKDRYLTSLSW